MPIIIGEGGVRALILPSVGSDKLDKRRLDNRANFSIIDNRPSITIIIELRPWQYYRATTGPMHYIYRPHTTFSLL